MEKNRLRRLSSASKPKQTSLTGMRTSHELIIHTYVNMKRRFTVTHLRLRRLRVLIFSAAVAEFHDIIVVVDGTIEVIIVKYPAEFAKRGCWRWHCQRHNLIPQDCWKSGWYRLGPVFITLLIYCSSLSICYNFLSGRLLFHYHI